jgi:glutathione S-transferase
MAPYILLKEVHADFETMNVNLGKGENNHPQYLKLNPKGKVPALIMGHETLTENLAIQLWIAQAFPAAQLMPSDPLKFAQTVSIMSWCSSGIHPKLTQQARPERYSNLPNTAENIKDLGSQSMVELFEIANEMLASKEWFMDHFTCADAYFYWCFKRGSAFGKDLSGLVHCQKHLQRMEQRPSVQALLQHEEDVKAAFARAA